MEMKSMMGAIVSVILVMAVVVPIISGLGSVQGDFDNNTSYYFAKAPLEEVPDFTISCDSEGVTTWTSGSTTMNISRAVGLPLVFSIDNNKGFKFPTASTGKIAVVTPTGLFSDVVEIKMESGQLSYTRSGGSATNFTITGDLWYITKTGDYGAYQSFKTNQSSEVVSFNLINSLSQNLRIYTEGTVTSQTTAYAYVTTGEAHEVTDTTTIALTYTISNGGVYNVTGGTIMMGDDSDPRTDLWFIAPVEYTGTEVSDNGIVNTLVGIIPVLLIAGVVVAIAASILWKRD